MASTWRKARTWQAGQLRDPYPDPSLPGPETLHVPEDPSPSSSHSPACDNNGPIPTAQYPGVPGVLTLLLSPPSGCSDAQPEDRNPSTTSFEAPHLWVLHHLVPLISPGGTCLQVVLPSGAWAVHGTLCPAALRAYLNLCPCVYCPKPWPAS